MGLESTQMAALIAHAHNVDADALADRRRALGPVTSGARSERVAPRTEAAAPPTSVAAAVAAYMSPRDAILVTDDATVPGVAHVLCDIMQLLFRILMVPDMDADGLRQWMHRHVLRMLDLCDARGGDTRTIVLCYDWPPNVARAQKISRSRADLQQLAPVWIGRPGAPDDLFDARAALADDSMRPELFEWTALQALESVAVALLPSPARAEPRVRVVVDGVSELFAARARGCLDGAFGTALSPPPTPDVRAPVEVAYRGGLEAAVRVDTHGANTIGEADALVFAHARRMGARTFLVDSIDSDTFLSYALLTQVDEWWADVDVWMFAGSARERVYNLRALVAGLAARGVCGGALLDVLLLLVGCGCDYMHVDNRKTQLFPFKPLHRTLGQYMAWAGHTGGGRFVSLRARAGRPDPCVVVDTDALRAFREHVYRLPPPATTARARATHARGYPAPGAADPLGRAARQAAFQLQIVISEAMGCGGALKELSAAETGHDGAAAVPDGPCYFDV